jgi:glycosyltransferase involved in cell wall biosynthesis
MAGKRPVEIYDRNYGKDDARYKFPDDFASFIVGHLPFDQIDKAYKGYHYAINMNSVKQSQSMFARRIFELLACNTVIASNFSRGLRLMFGDLVVCSDSGNEVVGRLDRIGVGVDRRKFKLLGLRKVMAEHTAEDRLAYVVSKIENKPAEPPLPKVLVAGYAGTKSDIETLIAHYKRQTYLRKELVIVASGGVDFSGVTLDETMRLISETSLKTTTIGELSGACERIIGMVAEDYYGPSYIIDLALASRYADAPIIGKGSHYVYREGKELALAGDGQQYSKVSSLQVRCSMVNVKLVKDRPAAHWMLGIAKDEIAVSDCISVDEFNYCRDGAKAEAQCAKFVGDIEGVDLGAKMSDIIKIAEGAQPEPPRFDESASVTGAEFAKWFGKPNRSEIGFNVEGNDLRITSSLDAEKHEYVYAGTHFKPDELGFGGDAKLHLEATPGLNIQIALLFLDEKKQRISHQMINANSNATCDVPAGTAFARIGLRIYGPGHASIRRLIKGHATLSRGMILGRARHLVLTNLYPQYDDLYRNGFVHSRVRAYKKHGVSVDVFRFRPSLPPGYHEFQGVDIMTGESEALDRLLSGHTYESIAVHFLDEAMWRVLERQCSKTKIIVWLHGSEIRPWWRRVDSYRTESEREAAKSACERRSIFWKQLMTKLPENLHFVFVSEHFANEAMSDIGVRLPDDRFSIVHNAIDTSLFEYSPKDAGSRKKVLSIRPFASRTYANDLTADAILALKSHRCFEDMEFRIIGDGPLFDEIVRPLRGLNNVTLEKGFLTQREIADIHTKYGIFLVPTRMDSQGVSRDEAMSSGLVPVTNAVAAIPEFVDSDCGRLAPAEDAKGLARAIIELYEQPDAFLRLSSAAAARVRRQSDIKLVIEKELMLLQGTSKTIGQS